MTPTSLSWAGILRLGLVQACLGAIVILTTSTMNRVMVVELALPAMLPGLLIALHYAVQIARPRFGYASDVGGRRTPWIVGGMALLGFGAVGASAAIALMGAHRALGIAVAFIAFVVIGAGVGASGTSLLALLAKRVEPQRRPAAATIVWIMMIAGFVAATAATGAVLAPYSPLRLFEVTAGVAIVAFLTTALALWRVEGAPPGRESNRDAANEGRASGPVFRAALREVWEEPQARQFTMFVFVSMLAYSGQELLVDPFAGAIFHMTPAQSTALNSVQHGGALFGMLLVAFLGSTVKDLRASLLRRWSVGGCVGSAIALASLAFAGFIGPPWPLRASVFVLGLANGAFAVSAIGSMMTLAGSGPQGREGVRMGIWGAAQALAFAIGGVVATGAVDLSRYLFGSASLAYSAVFVAEAILFAFASTLATRIGRPARAPRAQSRPGSRVLPSSQVTRA